MGSLPDSVNEQLLFSVFLTFGEIKSVEMPLDEERRHKGFGFVEYENADDASQAIDNMHEAELFGELRLT